MSTLRFQVGTDAGGVTITADLATLPHLLVAGTTGSGKSVFMHSVITELMATTNTRFLLFDPKRVEMSLYRDSPALIRQPVVDMEEAVGALRWAEFYMEQRFKLLQARGLRDWGQLPPFMARLVIVIDELANLILADKTIEKPLVALASQGRAAGVHLVVATQRPSADVLTGLLRANVPARAAFATVTQMESRIILDTDGAERLKGKGDMLFRNGTQLMRVQGRFVPETQIVQVAQGDKRQWA